MPRRRQTGRSRDRTRAARGKGLVACVVAALCVAIAACDGGAQPPGPPRVPPGGFRPGPPGGPPGGAPPPPPPLGPTSPPAPSDRGDAPGDDPARGAGNGADAAGLPPFEVHTSSLLQHRPGSWSTLDVHATNTTDEPREAFVSVLFEGAARQFARRFWVPPRSARSTWLPIRVPIPTTPQGGLEYTLLVLDAREAEREVLSRREGDALTSTSILRLADDPVRSMTVLPKPLADPTPREAAIQGDWPATLAAARGSRGLNTTSPMVAPDFLPPWPMALDGLDVMLVASDRLLHDTAGMAALRAWVRDGGRLWIALDAVSPRVLDAILGDGAGIETIDRVELDRFRLDSRDRENGMEASDEVDVENPIDLVRVATSHADVPVRVDGWPAAIWVPCGQGDVLVTTLGPRAWVEDDRTTVRGALRIVAARLLAGRPERLDPDRLRPSLERRIGYATPPRGLAALILGTFCALVAGAAWRFGGKAGGERMAWFVPAAGVATAGVLGLLGMASARTVAPTVAAAEFLRVAPETGEAWGDSPVAVYDRESRPIEWVGHDGTWLLPDAARGNAMERVVWLDDDAETTLGASTRAAGLESLRARGVTQAGPGFRARARFGPDGLEGSISPGGLGTPRDATVVGLPGPALAVAPGTDGSFRAGDESLLAPGQYVADTILGEDSRWRQEASRRLLASPEEWLAETGKPKSAAPAGVTGAQALRRRPWLLFWCDPREETRWMVPDGFVDGRSTLVLAPLELAPTPSGAPFRVPANFLVPRVAAGAQGRSTAFDARRGTWVKGLTSPTETVLLFEVPGSVLPCRLDRGRLAVKINAPSRVVEIGVWRDGEPTILATLREPAGLHEFDLSAADMELRSGAVPVRISVSATAAERAAREKGDNDGFSAAMTDTSVSSTWDIDYVRLSVDGHTLERSP